MKVLEWNLSDHLEENSMISESESEAFIVITQVTQVQRNLTKVNRIPTLENMNDSAVHTATQLV